LQNYWLVGAIEGSVGLKRM